MPEIAVGMADFKIAKDGDVLTTVLGSCVGVCLHSTRHNIAGLLHLMLPSAGDNALKPECKKPKYADTGLPELIRSMKSAGVVQSELTAKIFGGAKVLKEVERNLGQENVQAVQMILKEYGIPLKAYKVGGEKGYRIKFFSDSGKVVCQIFGTQAEEF